MRASTVAFERLGVDAAWGTAGIALDWVVRALDPADLNEVGVLGVPDWECEQRSVERFVMDELVRKQAGAVALLVDWWRKVGATAPERNELVTRAWAARECARHGKSDKRDPHLVAPRKCPACGPTLWNRASSIVLTTSAAEGHRPGGFPVELAAPGSSRRRVGTDRRPAPVRVGAGLDQPQLPHWPSSAPRSLPSTMPSPLKSASHAMHEPHWPSSAPRSFPSTEPSPLRSAAHS